MNVINQQPMANQPTLPRDCLLRYMPVTIVSEMHKTWKSCSCLSDIW